MSAPRPPVDDGHDDDARGTLTVLLAQYRREGLAGLRAAVTEQQVGRLVGVDDARGQAAETVALIVEAVLTIAEASSPALERRRAFEHFDRGEALDEAEREARQ